MTFTYYIDTYFVSQKNTSHLICGINNSHIKINHIHLLCCHLICMPKNTSQFIWGIKIQSLNLSFSNDILSIEYLFDLYAVYLQLLIKKTRKKNHICFCIWITHSLYRLWFMNDIISIVKINSSIYLQLPNINVLCLIQLQYIRYNWYKLWTMTVFD